jgi:Fe-S-cluster containining protein
MSGVTDPVPDAAEDTPREWYADGLSFKCTQCGNCCTGGPGYVWFDEAEGRAMAEAVGVDEREFYQRYAKRKLGRWTLEEVRVQRGQYDCIFLRRDEHGRGLCSVYQARPAQCRTWPFWESNLRSPDAWAAAAEDCPGMVLPQERAATRRSNFVPLEDIRIELAKNPPGL